MLRNIRNSDGAITVFYPSLDDYRLVMRAHFGERFAHYFLTDRNAKVILDFIVTNSGARIAA
jgi:hypothetical protein